MFSIAGGASFSSMISVRIFLSLRIAFCIGKTSAKCVLHNKNKGFYTFNVFGQIRFLMYFIDSDTDFATHFLDGFHGTYKFLEVEISKSFPERLCNRFWLFFRMVLGHLGCEETQKIDAMTQIAPKVCQRLSQVVPKVCQRLSEISATQCNSVHLTGNRITPDVFSYLSVFKCY